jgi:hypothetical protein
LSISALCVKKQKPKPPRNKITSSVKAYETTP